MIISIIHDENTFTLSTICRAFNNDEADEFAIENDHSKLTPEQLVVPTECIIMIYEPENLSWTELKPPLGKLTRIYDAAAVAAAAAVPGMPNLSVK